MTRVCCALCIQVPHLAVRRSFWRLFNLFHRHPIISTTVLFSECTQQPSALVYVFILELGWALINTDDVWCIIYGIQISPATLNSRSHQELRCMLNYCLLVCDLRGDVGISLWGVFTSVYYKLRPRSSLCGCIITHQSTTQGIYIPWHNLFEQRAFSFRVVETLEQPSGLPQKDCFRPTDFHPPKGSLVGELTIKSKCFPLNAAWRGSSGFMAISKITS
jgi:hypothetical protein